MDYKMPVFIENYFTIYDFYRKFPSKLTFDIGKEKFHEWIAKKLKIL